MARRFIKQFADGETIDEVYLVIDKQLRANRNGNPYLQIELRDRSGSITGTGLRPASATRAERSGPSTVPGCTRVPRIRDGSPNALNRL